MPNDGACHKISPSVGHESALVGSEADAVAAYDPLKWYDQNADDPPWINALAEVRYRASRRALRTIFGSVQSSDEKPCGWIGPSQSAGGMKANLFEVCRIDAAVRFVASVGVEMESACKR